MNLLLQVTTGNGILNLVNSGYLLVLNR
jgi:hypothetical protein